MSGIEVVGVVLGSLPLIISALEHMRSASSRLNLLVNFEAQYKKTLNDIRDEELMFRLQLKRLLVPLVKDDVLATDELEVLMLGIGGPLWNDAEVENALKARLQECYERYLETVEEVQCLAWQLLKPLSQSASFQDSLAKGSNPNSAAKQRLLHQAHTALCTTYRHQTARLRFATSSVRRDEIMDDIHKKIKKLSRLLEGGDQVSVLESTKRMSVPPRAVKALVQYWKHADRIYALLHQAWVCTCKQSHCAHLWLQHRTSPVFEFRMLVLFARTNGPGSPSPPWQQQGLRIQWAAVHSKAVSSIMDSSLDMPPPPSKQSILVKTASHAPRSDIAPKISSKKVSSKRTISFASGILSNSPGPLLASHPASSSKRARPDLEPANPTAVTNEIFNLCHEMTSCGMNQSCIGSLTDNNGDCRYIVSSQPEQKLVAEEISLAEVLEKSHKPRLKRSERFQIALKIASSHLQLHSTSWARKQWTARDVRFPCTSIPTERIMLDRPFVSADFNDASASIKVTPKAMDRSFACLGIMLLELLFGVNLEDHDLWHQLGEMNKTNPLFRLMVARQWADDVQDEAGPEFSAAVMWTLVDSPATLQGEQWRKDLADRVVLPLQNCNEWIHARPGT